MAIRIFITGGTFDKEYNELNGELYFKDTHMSDLLEKGRCKIPFEIRTLMMVDSLQMTDGDRSLIAHQCHSCDETQIVVTHGTDTMSETAKVLALKIKTRIKNNTNKSVELKVVYLVKGSYGIDIKSGATRSEYFPLGTKIFKHGKMSKPLFEITPGNRDSVLVIE